MADQRYIVNDWDHCLGHVIEECGEVLAAAGKVLRWGPHSANPEIPAEQQEPNWVWLRREMIDLRNALARLDAVIERGGVPRNG